MDLDDEGMSPPTTTNLTADVATSFRQPAREAFARISEAMKGLIEALPGPVKRAVDLQNALDIYSTLAWRTFKMATVFEPLDVANYMLTPALVSTLIEAAEKKGVPGRVTAEVRAAMDMYAKLQQTHAGDTESFMMMLSSLRPEKKSLLDEKFRKTLFQHNRLLWGSQTETSIVCFIVLPGAEPSEARTATIMGSTGYHQIRPSTNDIVLANRVSHLDIDNTGEIDTSRGFLTEFCSPNLNMQVVGRDNTAGTQIRIVVPEVGRQSAIDYFQLLTSNTRFEAHQGVSISTRVKTVGTMLHQDMMIPAESEPRRVFADVFGRKGDLDAVMEQLPEDRLPIELSPLHMGSFIDVPPAEGMPRYQEMIGSVLKRFDWYGRKFDIYRCRMPYPIIRTMVSLRAEAPPKR